MIWFQRPLLPALHQRLLQYREGKWRSLEAERTWQTPRSLQAETAVKFIVENQSSEVEVPPPFSATVWKVPIVETETAEGQEMWGSRASLSCGVSLPAGLNRESESQPEPALGVWLNKRLLADEDGDAEKLLTVQERLLTYQTVHAHRTRHNLIHYALRDDRWR